MLMCKISKCRDSIISIFFISLCVHFCNSQRQELFNENVCNCTAYSSCPNVENLIASSTPPLPCTYGKDDNDFKICCNPSNNIATTTPPSKGITWPSAPSNPVLSSKNATAIALQNCERYAEYRYKMTWHSPQITDEPGYWYKYADCMVVETLYEEKTLPKEHPHMALIGYGNDIKNIAWNCSGSLISERFILSAAHCGKFSQYGAPRWVLLGDVTTDSTIHHAAMPAIYEIVRVHDHPKYKPSSHRNDISLFELNTTVVMSGYVRPACLYTSISNPKKPSTSRIERNGWRKTDPNAQNSSEYLSQAMVRMARDKKCTTSYNIANNTEDNKFDQVFDPDTMICVRNFRYDEATCKSDIEGVLHMFVPGNICLWNIHGIATSGSTKRKLCSKNEKLLIYTRVAFYLDWIQSIVWP